MSYHISESVLMRHDEHMCFVQAISRTAARKWEKRLKAELVGWAKHEEGRHAACKVSSSQFPGVSCLFCVIAVFMSVMHFRCSLLCAAVKQQDRRGTPSHASSACSSSSTRGTCCLCWSFALTEGGVRILPVGPPLLLGAQDICIFVMFACREHHRR